MSSPREDIAQAEARMRVTFGTRTAIKNLHTIIEETETVRELCACLYAGGDGLLVLTDQRIIGVRDDYSKRHVRDHALTGAEKLDYDPVVHDGFAITTASGRLVVRKMNVEDSTRLVQCLRALLPTLVLEVTLPRANGHRAPMPTEQDEESIASAQGGAAVAAAGAVNPPSVAAGSSETASERAESAQAAAEQSALMEVLADLHEKGVLTDAEFAAKLTQVSAQGAPPV